MASSADEELLIQLREVFDLCDELKCGIISVNQLRDIVRKHFGGSEEEIARLIECLDPAGGGVIDFPQFCQGVQSCTRMRKDTPQNLPQLVIDGRSDSPPHLHETDSAIATGSDVSRESLADKRDSFSDGEENFVCHLSKPLDNSSDSFRSVANREGSGNPRRRRGSRISCKTGPKRLSTSALASQLHRSGSRRNSVSSDEMPVETVLPLSLEDDVLDLNHKVQELQQQVATLTDHQVNTDERYIRVKQENAALHNKIHSLEEQLRELEVRSEDRLETEQHNFKEMMARCERESKLEVEQYAAKLFSLQKECMETNEEYLKLKTLLEKIKFEKQELQNQLIEVQAELVTLREEHFRLQEASKREREEFQAERSSSNRLLDELSEQLERLEHEAGTAAGRIRSPSLLELPAQYRELQHELRRVKDENKFLFEANEEANAQLLASSLQEGRTLVSQKTTVSLADEFDTLTKDDLLKALQEQKEVNAKLKEYIDGILLNILDKNPQLLEV